MYTVRRVASESPAFYRPRFTLVKLQPRPKYLARRTLLWIGLVVACLAALIGVPYYVTENVPAKPLPTSVTNLPVYPGAQNAQVRETTPCSKVISFSSRDSADTIISFYEATLSKDGWSEGSGIEIGPFFWYDQKSLDGRVIHDYSIRVSFSTSSTNLQTVFVGEGLCTSDGGLLTNQPYAICPFPVVLNHMQTM